MKRGDVIIVDFPFSDATGRKIRPALILQADEWNRRLSDTILALITSSRSRFTGSATQLPIDISTPDGRESGLRLSSVVQCENLVTIDKSFVIHTIGNLSDALMQQMTGASRPHWGFDRRADKGTGRRHGKVCSPATLFYLRPPRHARLRASCLVARLTTFFGPIL